MKKWSSNRGIKLGRGNMNNANPGMLLSFPSREETYHILLSSITCYQINRNTPARLSKYRSINQIVFVDLRRQIRGQQPLFSWLLWPFPIYSSAMWISSWLHSTTFAEYFRSDKITFAPSAIFFANRIMRLTYYNCGICSQTYISTYQWGTELAQMWARI